MSTTPAGPVPEGGSSPRRAALLAISVVVTLVAAYVSWIVMIRAILDDCVGYDDEGVYVAPRSVRGMVECDAGGESVSSVLVLGVAAVALLLVLAAVVTWLRRRGTRLAVGLMVAAVVVPVLPVALLPALPADCSAAARATYGAEGCERDAELR